jgi:DNA-binding response OmpR family regulator
MPDRRAPAIARKPRRAARIAGRAAGGAAARLAVLNPPGWGTLDAMSRGSDGSVKRPPRRALVVEDDPDIVELLEHYLAADGWSVESTGNGAVALTRLRGESYQLLVLDLQLPGLDGLSLCREVRQDRRTRDLPVVMLTARGDEADRIVGLELGADDYIVKPFSPKELVARVRALFRRLERRDDGGDEDEGARLRFDRLEVDRTRHTVAWAGRPVHLTAKEFALLAALVEAGGRVLSRRRLLTEVWGYSYAEGTRTVDVHVRRLREKLPELAPAILTVKSLGYRLARPDEA